MATSGSSGMSVRTPIGSWIARAPRIARAAPSKSRYTACSWACTTVASRAGPATRPSTQMEAEPTTLGGNALTVADGDNPADDQRAAVAAAAEPIADLVAEGHQVLVTHGNGPQVGDLLRRSELAAEQVP